MLKLCPSCSYIGNDGEHVCPFCKADLSTGKPRHARERSVLQGFGGKRNASPVLKACYYKQEYPDQSENDAIFGFGSGINRH